MDLYAKLRNMNFLVVDDDEWVRNSLQLFLQSEGCKTVALETAEEGLDYIACNHCDIIFVDYKLPGMNGIDFIRHLPENQIDSIKVMFTAYGNKEMVLKAKKLGIDELIFKPFTMKTLESSLERIIMGSKKK